MRYGLTRQEVPKWLRFPFLNQGYRLGGDHSSCFLSLFRLHTETFNCWTFIFAFLFSTGAFVYTMVNYKPRGFDILPFLAFWLSCILHVPFSVCYHLFMCISQKEYNRWRRLDVSFIFISSVLLTFSLSFFVLPRWATGLLTCIAFATSVWAVSKISKLPEGRALDRKEHSLFVGVIVLVYCTPILFRAATDIAASNLSFAVLAAFLVLFFIGFGGWAYACSFPLRFWPDKFDIWCNSQTILHICVVGAHIVEYFFILKSYHSS